MSEKNLFLRILKSEPRKIGVDIDGTLTKEVEGWSENVYRNRTPRLKVISRLRRLHKAGHSIILFTSRYPEDKEITEAWLTKWKVPYHLVIFGKPRFDYLIGDEVENVREFLK